MIRVYGWVIEFSIIVESYARKTKVSEQRARLKSALEDRRIDTSSEIKVVYSNRRSNKIFHTYDLCILYGINFEDKCFGQIFGWVISRTKFFMEGSL